MRIAYEIIPKELQNLWNEWNLRAAVLISLFLQVILIFFASARKRSGYPLTHFAIWSSYLLADWIANVSVGLISSSQGVKCEKATVNDSLAAFWAPFLLLHLGGPDTITAFALEDNELWQRHMLGVIVQVIGVGYVFIQSLPNPFWLPTVLMFFAGGFKYAERTRSLCLASLDNLKDSLSPKPDPGPNYAQLMEQYSSYQAAGVNSEIYKEREPEKAKASTATLSGKTDLREEERIQHAYLFYDLFRGLIVDHMFSFHERNESLKFFFSRNALDAFKIMEVELNFLYDALYTKMATVHNGFFWYILRFVSSASLIAAFVIFVSHHKTNIHRFDIAITYALLGGAVILDFVALVKLVFSNWTIALLEHSEVSLIVKMRPALRYLKVASGVLAVQRRISARRRWCGYLSQHSLIRYCLHKRFELLDKTAELFALKGLLDTSTLMFRRKWIPLDDDLKKFIFDELEGKAKRAEETKSAKDIYSSRGRLALLHYDCPQLVEESVSEDVEYDESVLMWHIATDICFSRDSSSKNTEKARNWCKHLSDYLLYLLVMKPKLMLAVAGIAHIRFQDTCEEARKFFGRDLWKLVEQSACEKLIKVDTTVRPVEVKGDRSKSLLFDAVRLAKDLRNMEDNNPERTWEMMSKVWLELLCYGASHCRGDAHAQQLRQGGELITFVWLLMAHFGLGDQFRIEAGHARAKLIVEK